MLTSRNKGTPVALIEAMASGVPGVSTTWAASRTSSTSEDVGARVPNGDAAGLAAHSCVTWPIPSCAAFRSARRAAVLDRYSLDGSCATSSRSIATC